MLRIFEKAFKAFCILFQVSLNLTLWTDAATYANRGHLYTVVGWVYRDRNRPPILGTNGYKNMKTAEGELKAAVEGLRDVASYCKSMHVKPKKCSVTLNTDFDYMHSLLKMDRIKLPWKSKLQNIDNLIEAADMFYKVDPRLVFRGDNIAHYACHNKSPDDEKFLRIYNNPLEECKLKVVCR
jgi:hypothetical protein